MKSQAKQEAGGQRGRRQAGEQEAASRSAEDEIIACLAKISVVKASAFYKLNASTPSFPLRLHLHRYLNTTITMIEVP